MGTSPMRKSKGLRTCVTGRALTSIFIIDLKVYNVLLCHAARLPTIKRANRQTVFVVFVTVKNRHGVNPDETITISFIKI